MNIVFLDVDGVLNCDSTTNRVQGFIGVDPKKVELLKQIVDATNAEIVLTSTWKMDFYEDAPRYPKIKNYLVKKLKDQGLSISGLTVDNWSNRGFGIIRYIQDHPCDGYVVLDDEFFTDYKQCGIVPHWVHTSFAHGLLPKHVEIAIRKMSLPVVIPDGWDAHVNMPLEELIEYDRGKHDEDEI